MEITIKTPNGDKVVSIKEDGMTGWYTVECEEYRDYVELPREFANFLESLVGGS